MSSAVHLSVVGGMAAQPEFRGGETTTKAPLPGVPMVDDFHEEGIQLSAKDTESIEHLISPLRPLLELPGLQELVINRPGEVLIEMPEGWRVVQDERISFDSMLSLAGAIATWSAQDISEVTPILGATLATGERCQFVVPPAVEAGLVSVTMRKPSTKIWRLHEFESQGMFRNTNIICDSRVDVLGRMPGPAGLDAALAEQRRSDANVSCDSPAEVRSAEARGVRIDAASKLLLERLWDNDIAGFARDMVKLRKNIIVTGATGSGKTTFMKAIMQECNRLERVITIEDAREIFLPYHRNKVHLLYSKGGQGKAKVTAQSLLVSCLRMRPDRILLAEIREAEAFDFLRTAASGHPGAISSAHAGSPAEAFEQMGLMVKQSEAGSGLTHGEIRRLLMLSIDVIVQYKREHHDENGSGTSRRFVSDVYFRPVKKAEISNV